MSGKGLSSIEILSQDDATPKKAYVYGASANTLVYIEIVGDIDVDEEIKKAQVKLKKASDVAAKQAKLVNADDFQTKVSSAVQDIEKAKLDELQSQVQNYEKSIEMFNTLKL